MSIATGVAAVFSASHRDPMSGALHGHDYQVVAWFNGDPLRRFEVLQVILEQTVRVWDHTELPPELWSAEAIGKALLGLLAADCVRVDVNRPLIGHFVTVTL